MTSQKQMRAWLRVRLSNFAAALEPERKPMSRERIMRRWGDIASELASRMRMSKP